MFTLLSELFRKGNRYSDYYHHRLVLLVVDFIYIESTQLEFLLYGFFYNYSLGTWRIKVLWTDVHASFADRSIIVGFLIGGKIAVS